MVAAKHLHNEGYRVDLAENGEEAVKAFAAKHYDLVLMDVQMPVMDGYDATRAIREHRKSRPANGAVQRGADGVPIIALTAHAVKEYIDKCIESGMNDFVTKPLRRTTLVAMIEKWTSAKRPGRPRPAPGSRRRQSTPPCPCDFEKAVAEFSGDRLFLEELLAEFLGSVRPKLAVLREALDAGDAETVHREAHAINGAAANLTANPLAAVARVLERVGESGVLDSGRDVLERLAAEFARLEECAREQTDRTPTVST